MRYKPVDHSEPPTKCAMPDGLAGVVSDDIGSPPKAAAILSQLEQCLDHLDELGWTLQAAHLSLAVESLRDKVASRRLHMVADRPLV